MLHPVQSTDGITPIHVRGKNKRPTNREREAAVSSGKGKRKPGRPLKKRLAPATDEETSSQVSRASTPSFSSKQPPKKRLRRPRRSQLESLPQEILERIFLLSENLSLALASPHLTGRLSSEYIFDNLSSQAFPAAVLREDDHRPDRADLQNAIVRQPWFTVDRLNKLERTWTGATSPIRWPHLRLPTRLFRRPFTDENVDLLKALLDIGGRVDWISTSTGEYAMECLEQAIIEENTRLISLLVKRAIGLPFTPDLWNYVAKPNWAEDPTRKKVQRMMDRIEDKIRSSETLGSSVEHDFTGNEEWADWHILPSNSDLEINGDESDSGTETMSETEDNPIELEGEIDSSFEGESGAEDEETRIGS